MKMPMCCTCRWCYYLNKGHFCILAREKITREQVFDEENPCEFWRPDKHDDIHDNDAMDRTEQKDTLIVPYKE